MHCEKNLAQSGWRRCSTRVDSGSFAAPAKNGKCHPSLKKKLVCSYRQYRNSEKAEQYMSERPQQTGHREKINTSHIPECMQKELEQITQALVFLFRHARV
ncbi:hypothetical protein TNCV_4586211 [Trichonephila clavipes]|nr:hypothetical protein TNCV_4586211 [Trichonephila clavipes]